MFRNVVVAGIALSLATPALAAPAWVSAHIGQVENLSGGDESAWMLPVGAILIAALIILIDGDGNSDTDFPTSP
ncbi:hypothetical protein [Altererythrobacter sp. Root672]|uniref:hypothetical protein n=1 Tax=Altererythrobacter sp. Root672 TaxID=1736584 RepID=UPI000AB67B0F|nr:hypothetical protein [Altererythrobacter sp. Root672]